MGKGHPIYPHPDFTQKLDYEGELGIIVGKGQSSLSILQLFGSKRGAGGRGITKEEAWDHVWGATIINDVSARDRQKMHAQVFIGKSLDTFCPMVCSCCHCSKSYEHQTDHHDDRDRTPLRVSRFEVSQLRP